MTVDAFRAPTGLVVPAITTEQMREVDRVAVNEVGPNLYQMMENAGRNLASLCVELLGDGWHRAPIVVLAGTGGNGGGGICAARHLANHGGDVTVVSLDVPSGLDSTTGTAPGECVHATTTMTLALPKTGLDADAVGRLWLADIGIPREVYSRVGVHPPEGLFTPGYRVQLAQDGQDGTRS